MSSAINKQCHQQQSILKLFSIVETANTALGAVNNSELFAANSSLRSLFWA
jgi:hypothetical protein